MSVPTPLILFDQITRFVALSCGFAWFHCCFSGLVVGVCRGRVEEAFVVVVDVFVVRDWVVRESGIPVTPGGRGTGKRRFLGMRVDVGECRGGWVLNDAGNSGMWMQWKWGNGGEMMKWMHSMLWKN
eukprot:scaffold14962_cov139-Cylindrotheca_fusiformis.AAC.2